MDEANLSCNSHSNFEVGKSNLSFSKGRVLDCPRDSHLLFVNVIQMAVEKARLQQGAGMVPIVFRYKGTLVLRRSLFGLRSCNQMMLKENEFEIRRQRTKMYFFGCCKSVSLGTAIIFRSESEFKMRRQRKKLGPC